MKFVAEKNEKDRTKTEDRQISMFDSKLTNLLCQDSRRQLQKENKFLLQLVAAKLQAKKQE